jgi:hypothetical protein
VQDASKALSCELAGDVLKCGGKGFTSFGLGDMVKLTTVSSGGSGGWSIDGSNNIKWNAKSSLKFSLRNTNEIWAEVCPDTHGHFTGRHGSAKAVYE